MTRRSSPIIAAGPFVLLAAQGCGSRTTAGVIEGPPECLRDEDCDGAGDRCHPVQCNLGVCQALAPVDCDDKNPCTRDVCDEITGVCSHPDATADLDRDGHLGVLPGKLAGEAGACGDDCDDRNAAAFPGGSEICDGVDNDCNGVVDEGSALAPIGEAVLVSEGTTAVEPASLAFANGNYLAALNGEINDRNVLLILPITRTGARAAAPTRLGASPADITGGSLVWIGDRVGVTWSDRREALGGLNFEVYFTLLNPDRTKRLGDLRLTRAEGFSLGATIAFTGLEFVVLWQDDGRNVFSIDEVHGQRLDRDGAPVGSDVHLAQEGPQTQTAPTLAVGRRSLGAAWVRGEVPLAHRVIFAPFDFELRPLARPTVLSTTAHAVYPTVVYSAPHFIIAWYEDPPGPNIFGAVRGELGQEVVRAKVITSGNRHARTPALLPFGDRVLLVWADDRDGNTGYELYAKTLDSRLEPLGPEQRLTYARGDSIDPLVAFGPGGDVGILFSDNRPGVPQTFFTRLGCEPAAAP